MPGKKKPYPWKNLNIRNWSRNPEAQDAWDKLLRLQADFDNARKRWKGIEASLSVRQWRFALWYSDYCRRIGTQRGTFPEKHEDYTAFLKGVEMILAHLHDLLKKNGFVALKPKKCFDPNYHEALMQVENDDLPEHTVVEEMQKGYTLNDKVLRTAKVQVSKKKKTETDLPQEEKKG